MTSSCQRKRSSHCYSTLCVLVDGNASCIKTNNALFAMVSIAEEVAKELEEETYYRRSNEKDHEIQDSQRAHPGILKVFTPEEPDINVLGGDMSVDYSCNDNSRAIPYAIFRSRGLVEPRAGLATD